MVRTNATARGSAWVHDGCEGRSFVGTGLVWRAFALVSIMQDKRITFRGAEDNPKGVEVFDICSQ